MVQTCLAISRQCLLVHGFLGLGFPMFTAVHLEADIHGSLPYSLRIEREIPVAWRHGKQNMERVMAKRSWEQHQKKEKSNKSSIGVVGSRGITPEKEHE